MNKELENLEREVEQTKSSIVNTLEQVEHQVKGKFSKVKESLAISNRVEAHPLAAVGGSVLAGFLVGAVAFRRNSSFRPESSGPSFPLYSEGESESLRASVASQPPRSNRREPGFFRELASGLASEFDDEIRMAKGMAIGAGLSALVRQVDKKAPALTEYLKPIVQSVNDKVGYGPLRERPRSTSDEAKVANG